jgi:hypothetical protein
VDSQLNFLNTFPLIQAFFLATSIFNCPELYRNIDEPFEPEMLEKAHKDYGKVFHGL